MKTAILILGMHRSGTSALTRVISLMGASLPKSLLGKDQGNERGHWESRVMIESHDNLLAELGSDWTDWRRLSLGRKTSRQFKNAADVFSDTLAAEYADAELGVIKEPRICRFAQPYIETLEAGGVELHTLIMVRNPLEVAASLTERDGVDKLDGLYLWLTHMIEAEKATRGKSRQFISYDAFLSNPVKTAVSVAKAAPFGFPYKATEVAKQIESYVSPNLKRQSAAIEDIALDPLAAGWVSDAYEALLVLCESPKSKGALKKIDSVSASYFDVLPPLYDILMRERSRLNENHKKMLADEHALHEAAVSALQSEHGTAWSARESEHHAAWAERESKHKISWAAREADYKNQWSDREQEYGKVEAAMQKRLQDLNREHAETISQMSESISHMRDEFGDMLRAVETRANQSEADVRSLRGELEAVFNSTSWKMTGGLRRFMNVLKGVKTDSGGRHLTADDTPLRLEYKSDDPQS